MNPAVRDRTGDFAMKPSFVASVILAIAAALIVIGNTPAQAVPVVSVGDTFTGTMTLDPTTPCSYSCVSGASGPGSFYGIFNNPGTVTANIGGDIFSGVLSSTTLAVYPGLSPSSNWYAFANNILLNGNPTAIPSQNGIDVVLFGNTPSTSVLPLNLSSYDPASSSFDVFAYFATSDPYIFTFWSIDGRFTTLMQNDSVANYSFSGTITDVTTFTETVGPAATPLPAALPLFASGLGALGLLGWRRKRKAAALAA